MKDIVFANCNYIPLEGFYDELLSLNVNGFRFSFVNLSHESSLFRIRPDDNRKSMIVAYTQAPDHDSEELFRRLRDSDPSSPLVLCSIASSSKDVRSAFLSGFSDFLPVPFTWEDLSKCADHLIGGAVLEVPGTVSSIIESSKDNRISNEEILRSLTGASPLSGMKSARARYELIANKFTVFASATAQINLNADDFSGNKADEYIPQYLEILYQHCDDDYLSGNYDFEFIHAIIGDQLCMFLYAQNNSSGTFNSQIKAFSEQLVSRFYHHTNYTARIGLSSVFNDLPSATTAFAESVKALDQGFYIQQSSKHVFVYSPEYKEFSTAYDDLQPVFDNVSKGKNIDAFYEVFKQLLDDFEARKLHPDFVKRSLVILFNRYIYDSTAISPSAKNLMYFEHHIEKSVERISNAYDIIKYFARLIDHLLYTTYSSKSGGNELASQAENYVLSHYEEQITLSVVAEHLSVNANYLCVLFKKHTGMNFLQYLTQIRINKAKFLLSNTDKKIYEIGALVGYPETVSFTRAFTRTQSISPKEYRRSMHTGNYKSEEL